jgi:hypothetical protein
MESLRCFMASTSSLHMSESNRCTYTKQSEVRKLICQLHGFKPRWVTYSECVWSCVRPRVLPAASLTIAACHSSIHPTWTMTPDGLHPKLSSQAIGFYNKRNQWYAVQQQQQQYAWSLWTSIFCFVGAQALVIVLSKLPAAGKRVLFTACSHLEIHIAVMSVNLRWWNTVAGACTYSVAETLDEPVLVRARYIRSRSWPKAMRMSLERHS